MQGLGRVYAEFRQRNAKDLGARFRRAGTAGNDDAAKVARQAQLPANLEQTRIEVRYDSQCEPTDVQSFQRGPYILEHTPRVCARVVSKQVVEQCLERSWLVLCKHRRD